MLKFQVAGDPGGNLLEHLLLESIGATRGGGIFAWANASGARTLLEDTVMDAMLVASDFRLVIGTDSITDSRAIAKLASISASRPRLQVSAFLSPTSSLFHPKLAWFEHADHVSLIVGSGNLTMGGLLSNWEAFTVLRLEGTEANHALEEIQSFLTRSTDYLLPITSQAIQDRVAENDGNERNIRHTETPSAAAQPVAAAPNDDVLVAEIPGSGNRWSQANFDRSTHEGFFGAKIGSQRRIVLQNVSASGEIGEIESRPSVEVKSKNYRFEIAAAKGIAYPVGTPPIGIFLRVSTGQFLYSLLLPESPGYAEMSSFLDTNWSGRADRKRRIISTVATLKASWPEAPIWQTTLPDL